MILILRICLATASFSCVYCLTCLHCTDIESPRHCKHVMECPSGEVCHMHMTTTKYGEVLYDLGCTETSTCYNRSHGNQLCDDCCSTDLCNAAGCGHTGFPSGRGPICYSCSAQTTEGSCHTIDFCATNEMCMINEEREFGDTVYTSRCAVNAHCENQKTETAAFIGRSVSQHSRSVTETMCHQCCHRDLCNAHCVPITKADYCASTPCVNGRCDNSMTGYTCVCDQLYMGQNCSEVDYCASTPCVHGRCVNGITGYTCVCDPLYNGQICSDVDYCSTTPCVHGKCVNGKTGYTCVCDQLYTGQNCSEAEYCASTPCVHGRCVNGMTGYNCVCDQLYTGQNCSELNYCASTACVHGRCVNDMTGYTCVCDPLYTGRNCSEVDYCASTPCLHGRYINGSTGYTCVCELSYTGKNCSEVEYCASNPCDHGRCVKGMTGYRCVCDPLYMGENCSERLKKDCRDLRSITNVSGVYKIQPEGSMQTIDVYCDMTADGGGWTVFQRRVNGSVDFYQNFSSYENGFGDLRGEFWLGLKYIHNMTFYSRSELRIELMNSRLRTGYGMYSNFWVSASPNYTLNVDRGHGNISLEDTFGMDFYAGYRFLTYDNGDINNASLIGHGGWWYRGCSYCGTVNLNGQYITPGTRNYPYEHAAVFYYSFDLYFSLKETKMMFRRI